MSTIERDCRVLESFDIMDYSLLLAVHNLDEAKRENDKSEVAEHEKKRSFQPNTTKLVAHSTPMESIQAYFFFYYLFAVNFCLSSTLKVQAGSFEEDDIAIDERMRGGIPATNSAGERLLIFVGIIDILQSYRLVKKMEHTFKAIIHDGVGAAIDYIDFSFIILYLGHSFRTQASLLCKPFQGVYVKQGFQENSSR